MSFWMIFLATLCGVIAALLLRLIFTVALRVIIEYRRFCDKEKPKGKPVRYNDSCLEACLEVESSAVESLLRQCEKMNSQLDGKLEEGLMLLEAIDKRMKNEQYKELWTPSWLYEDKEHEDKAQEE